MGASTVRLLPVARRRGSAFSLVELLIVIVIIVILIGAVVAVGSAQARRAKRRETRALLENLRLAARQFAVEKPLGKVRGYRSRYNDYPPDELDGFVAGVGIPGSDESIAPGGGNSSVKLPDNDKIEKVDHGDIKAFALAVRAYSDAGAAILDRIQPKYRRAAHHDATGVPDEYLDRDGSLDFTPGGDDPLDYFVDTWGTPIAYFATAADAGSTPASLWDSDTSRNVQVAGDRQRACQALFSLSNGVPVFVSYGPDGPEQFHDDFKEDIYWPDLIYDFNEPEQADRPEFTFDHALNQDNLYSNETVQDKILRVNFAEGIREGTEH